MIYLKPHDSKLLRINNSVDVKGGVPAQDIDYTNLGCMGVYYEYYGYDYKSDELGGLIKLDTIDGSEISHKNITLSNQDLWVSLIEKERFERDNKLREEFNHHSIFKVTKKGHKSAMKQLIDEVDQELEASNKEKPSSNEVWNQLKHKKNDINIEVSFYELIWYNGVIKKKVKLSTFQKYLSEIRRARREAKNPS